MTTLQVHPSEAARRRCLLSGCVELKVSTSFPHGVSIRVVEQPPLAPLPVGGTNIAVAATGVVLGPGLASGSLPVLAGASLPAPGQHLHNAAPPPRRGRARRRPGAAGQAGPAAHGTGQGPDARHAQRPACRLRRRVAPARRKWLALARVRSPRRARPVPPTLDVRVPERPAAGFPVAAARRSPPPAEAEAAPGSSGGESHRGDSPPLDPGASFGFGGKGGAAGRRRRGTPRPAVRARARRCRRHRPSSARRAHARERQPLGACGRDASPK